MKSIEENLDRIASALEGLNNIGERVSEALYALGGVDFTPAPAEEPAASGTTGGTTSEAADEPVTREGVQAALTAFVTDGPGKAKAKEVLGEFKAGSISTLDAGDYAAFVARLAAVAAA